MRALSKPTKTRGQPTRARDRPTGLVTAASVLLLAACGPDDGAANREDLPAGTPVEITAEARIAVGVLEGDTLQEFHRVVTPFLLPSGELVVPDAGARAIRVFGGNGDYSRTLGGPGSGPGEFGALDAAWARGDTVEAFDSSLLRITRFLPDGTAEAVDLEKVASAQTALPGALADGWALAGVADAGMGRRDEMVVHRFGGDGSHLGEVARVEGMARFVNPAVSGPDPLSPRAVFALGADEVYVGETMTPRVAVHDPGGGLKREITWEPEPQVSPEQALRLVVDSAVARAAPDEGERLRRRLEAFPERERLSAFWDVMVDEAGFVWVRPFEPAKHAQALGGFRGPGAGGAWTIFSREGEALGSVEVPAELEPASVGREAVVGIRRDALGVERVQVHGLRRAEGR